MVVCNKKWFFLAAIVAACATAYAQSKKDSVWIQTKDGCKVHNPVPQKNETISWTGPCVNGYATGEGTLIWYKDGKQNQTYTGAMKRGSPHGYGKYDYGTGTVYEGQYALGRMEGTGKIAYSDKRGVYYTYEGSIINGKLEGRGTEIYYEKADTVSIYQGDFLNDVRHGHGINKKFWEYGVYVFEGKFHEGNLEDDRAEIHDYRNGLLIAHYKGAFRNEARNGYGEEVTGFNKYQGQWQNDEKLGMGKLTHDGKLVYEGDWKDDQFEGIGTRHFFDGSKYKGQFSKNERHGFGVMRWSDGACYIGEFKRDLFSGKGYTLYQNNRVNKAGTWEKGTLAMAEDIVPLKKFLETRYGDLVQRMKD